MITYVMCPSRGMLALKFPFSNYRRFGSPLLAVILFSQVRNYDKKEFFFYHAPHVGFHVVLKEIRWDYVEPEAILDGKRI
jgi:hypothetical protein